MKSRVKKQTLSVPLKSSFNSFIFSICIACLYPAMTRAAASLHEIKVTLFDQPCTLKGPFDDSTLKMIHTISPEQVSPSSSFTSVKAKLEDINKGLKKLESVSKLPQPIFLYQEKLTKRLQAQKAILEFLKNHTGKEGIKNQATQLTTLTQKFFINKNRAKEFVELADKFSFKKTSDIEKFLEIYNQLIEPDPEDEFHRGTRKLEIHYQCSFEAGEENSDNSSE